MSTRATYAFHDESECYTVYKHYDGYPEGAAEWIMNAIPYAWPLPRIEACDFAAAFIRGNKEKGGDVYVTSGYEHHGDTEYHYDVEWNNGVNDLIVTCWTMEGGKKIKAIYDGPITGLASVEG